jgi:hypothetical protein
LLDDPVAGQRIGAFPLAGDYLTDKSTWLCVYVLRGSAR